tara:strand:+ start:261 stop:938 length:678 start_codon:yes stop_codon:yes gene_type:complete
MKKKQSCIFLGKKNCNFTDSAIKFLNKKFNVTSILTHNIIGEKKNLSKIKSDYLFSYSTKLIIPKEVFKRIKYGSFNFHNALPQYPGSGGNVLSIYNNDKFCGNTIHYLSENIDQGKIIFVEKYIMDKNFNIQDLLKFVSKKKLILFKYFIGKISDHNWIKKMEKKFSNEKWAKKVVKMKYINQLRQINLNMEKKDVDKIIKAFSFKKYKPYIIFKKNKFSLDKI